MRASHWAAIQPGSGGDQENKIEPADTQNMYREFVNRIRPLEGYAKWRLAKKSINPPIRGAIAPLGAPAKSAIVM
jgi:hypothetical protein